MKSVIALTPAAQTHINEILSSNTDKVFAISIDNRGCSGHSYVYELCDPKELSTFDETIALSNGSVVIKAQSVMRLLGSTLDLESNELGTQFLWHNPQVSSTCGCGKSVSF